MVRSCRCVLLRGYPCRAGMFGGAALSLAGAGVSPFTPPPNPSPLSAMPIMLVNPCFRAPLWPLRDVQGCWRGSGGAAADAAARRLRWKAPTADTAATGRLSSTPRDTNVSGCCSWGRGGDAVAHASHHQYELLYARAAGRGAPTSPVVVAAIVSGLTQERIDGADGTLMAV